MGKVQYIGRIQERKTLLHITHGRAGWPRREKRVQKITYLYTNRGGRAVGEDRDILGHILACVSFIVSILPVFSAFPFGHDEDEEMGRKHS